MVFIFPWKCETRSSFDGEGGREAKECRPKKRGCQVIILENMKLKGRGYREE